MFNACSLHATGLYISPPSYFSVIDTSRIFVTIRQTGIQRDAGRASVLAGELALKYKRRVGIRLGLLYPALQGEGDILHNVGDGAVHATVRIFGDTLESSGLFVRGDVRIPVGSKSLRPLSFGSLDGGAGLEFRHRTPLLGFRCAATYTLVGDRCKVGSFIHRNFLLLGFAIDFVFRKGTLFNFSGFNTSFRGGDSRDVYLLTVKQELSDTLWLLIDAALEAGNDEERVFNSLASLAVLYRFPSKDASDNGK